MLEGSIAFTLSGATKSKFKALFSVWLPDYEADSAKLNITGSLGGRQYC